MTSSEVESVKPLCMQLLGALGISKERGEVIYRQYEENGTSRDFLRALMNQMPVDAISNLSPAFFEAQDQLLQAELSKKTVTDSAELPRCAGEDGGALHRMALWKGDICALKVDGIVNAANSGLLGCFQPLHRCIDNAIHSAAGLELRRACQEKVVERANKEGVPPDEYEEPTGLAIITEGYNLPSKYVLHTVGPIYPEHSPKENIMLLQSCYRSCLDCALVAGLRSLAFCCISTGEFMFPPRLAVHVAVDTVAKWLDEHPATESSGIDLVVFDVFKEEDNELYSSVLSSKAAAAASTPDTSKSSSDSTTASQ